MAFDSKRALKQATSRAKSDVANKLVSMFLHEVSRKACLSAGQSVGDEAYGRSVVECFGDACIYCRRDLENDRAVVEHLDGMNRFRAGLHIPGNVAIACRRCNNEKRRDDQLPELTLADSGWESYLSHDSTRCRDRCPTCLYWQSLHPSPETRAEAMRQSAERIRTLRKSNTRLIAWSESMRPSIRAKAENLYRRCQDFAASEIRTLAAEFSFDLSVAPDSAP